MIMSHPLTTKEYLGSNNCSRDHVLPCNVVLVCSPSFHICIFAAVRSCMAQTLLHNRSMRSATDQRRFSEQCVHPPSKRAWWCCRCEIKSSQLKTYSLSSFLVYVEGPHAAPSPHLARMAAPYELCWPRTHTCLVALRPLSPLVNQLLFMVQTILRRATRSNNTTVQRHTTFAAPMLICYDKDVSRKCPASN